MTVPSFIEWIPFGLGCAGQIVVKQTIAEPSQLSPGDDVKYSVVLNGSPDKVAEIKVTVREHPELVFDLYNNGEEGDEKAGDNIWTYQSQIPWEAPANTYHLDLCVRDAEGKEIITKGFEHQSTGRSGTIVVTVK